MPFKFGLLALLALTAVSLLLYAAGSDASPTVKWEPSALSIQVGAGQSATTLANFVASEDAENVVVSVAPELELYLAVSPSSFPIIEKGRTYTVTVTGSVPSDAPLDTRDGTIHLKKGKRTLARPLPVSVVVVAKAAGARYQNDQYRFAFSFPSDPDFTESIVDVPAVLYSMAFHGSDDEADVGVDVYDNAAGAPIDEWYRETTPDKLSIHGYESTLADAPGGGLRDLTVAGARSLEVQGEVMGYRMIGTYVPHGNRVIEIGISVPDSWPVPDTYFDIVNSLELF